MGATRSRGEQRSWPCCAGSGKTLAFLLPALACCARHAGSPGPLAVILEPTKELQVQTFNVAARLAAGLPVQPTLLTKAAAAGSELGKVRARCTSRAQLGLRVIIRSGCSGCEALQAERAGSRGAHIPAVLTRTRSEASNPRCHSRPPAHVAAPARLCPPVQHTRWRLTNPPC